MKALVTGLTLTALLASSSLAFAGPEGKGEKKGEKKDRDPAEVFKKLDANSDGSVLADDFSAVKKRFFSSTTNVGSGDAAYSAFADVDGSGTILANDTSEVKRRFFTTLPPDPSAAAPLTVRRVTEGVL